jgi:hypothetical protein
MHYYIFRIINMTQWASAPIPNSFYISLKQKFCMWVNVFPIKYFGVMEDTELARLNDYLNVVVNAWQGSNVIWYLEGKSGLETIILSTETKLWRCGYCYPVLVGMPATSGFQMVSDSYYSSDDKLNSFRSHLLISNN